MLSNVHVQRAARAGPPVPAGGGAVQAGDRRARPAGLAGRLGGQAARAAHPGRAPGGGNGAPGDRATKTGRQSSPGILDQQNKFPKHLVGRSPRHQPPYRFTAYWTGSCRCCLA